MPDKAAQSLAQTIAKQVETLGMVELTLRSLLNAGMTADEVDDLVNDVLQEIKNTPTLDDVGKAARANDVPVKFVAKPELAAEPVTEPVVKPVTEPVVKPVTEPVVKPVTEPVVKPVAEPVAKPAFKAVSESIANSIAEPIAPLPDVRSEKFLAMIADLSTKVVDLKRKVALQHATAAAAMDTATTTSAVNTPAVTNTTVNTPATNTPEQPSASAVPLASSVPPLPSFGPTDQRKRNTPDSGSESEASGDKKSTTTTAPNIPLQWTRGKWQPKPRSTRWMQPEFYDDWMSTTWAEEHESDDMRPGQ
ncbi:hypothetical protein C8A03DRAFT_34931 [Achaetomium macrosporum]|uniref:Uncharacterized protein n=1 Tax=Achaetomium macrosporum TaxID=79813 RepID=A0AAN7C7Y5_9PEZI|nr:hypothetical protein C8A03DRAFT_34931 [Achaetomium macrosporum]